jgi:hypothetical protein
MSPDESGGARREFRLGEHSASNGTRVTNGTVPFVTFVPLIYVFRRDASRVGLSAGDLGRSPAELADAVAVLPAAEAVVRAIRQIDVHGIASWVAVEVV